MTGNVALVARYALIIACGWLANAGIGVFDLDALTFTFSIEHVASLIGGAASLAVAVVWRKAAKWRGGKT